MGRRVAREVVFKYLFEKDMNKELGFDRDFYSKREDVLELEEAQVGYVLDTVENVLINIDKIDKYIEILNKRTYSMKIKEQIFKNTF